MSLRYLCIQWDASISQICPTEYSDIGIPEKVLEGIIKKANLVGGHARVAKILSWVIDIGLDKGCLKIDRDEVSSLHFPTAYMYHFIPNPFMVIKYIGSDFKLVDFSCEGSAVRTNNQVPLITTSVKIRRCQMIEIDEGMANAACMENPGFIIHTIYHEEQAVVPVIP
jgi:hypothetical protein